MNRIGCVAIDDRANDEDAAAGTMAAAGGGRRTGRCCQSNVKCAMYWGKTTDDATYVIARGTRMSNGDVECTEKHEKHEKHEITI